MRRSTPIVLVILAMLALRTSASASLIPFHIATNPTTQPRQYTYDIIFSTNGSTERLDPGDFVTLYDVPEEFVTPAGFTAILQNLGQDAFLTAPVDDPAIGNITLVYTGPVLRDDAVFSGFTIFSPVANRRFGHFTSETNLGDGPFSGTQLGHTGAVFLPPVPEPSTAVALLVPAVLAFPGRRLRRNS